MEMASVETQAEDVPSTDSNADAAETDMCSICGSVLESFEVRVGAFRPLCHRCLNLSYFRQCVACGQSMPIERAQPRCHTCESIGPPARPSPPTKRMARLLNGSVVDIDLRSAIFVSLARTGGIRWPFVSNLERAPARIMIRSASVPQSDPKVYLHFAMLIRLPEGRWLAEGLEASTPAEFLKAICTWGVPRLVEIEVDEAKAALRGAWLTMPETATWKNPESADQIVGPKSIGPSTNQERDDYICDQYRNGSSQKEIIRLVQAKFGDSLTTTGLSQAKARQKARGIDCDKPRVDK